MNQSSGGSIESLLDRLQVWAWDDLRHAVLARDGGNLSPDDGGRVLRSLLLLLQLRPPVSIDQIDVEVLSSGLYETVLRRAGFEPDARIFDRQFQLNASREFELDPGETLWDSTVVQAAALEEILAFSDTTGPRVGPNLVHSTQV